MTKRHYDDHVRTTTATATAPPLPRQYCQHCRVPASPDTTRRRRSSASRRPTKMVITLKPCQGGCVDPPWYCTDACALQDWPAHQPRCHHAINRCLPVKHCLETVQESLVDELEIEYELTVLEGGFRSGGTSSPVMTTRSDDSVTSGRHETESPEDASSSSWTSSSSSSSSKAPEPLQLDTVLAVLGASPEWTALVEAQEIVRTLAYQSTRMKKKRFLQNKKLLVALMQRLFEDDRRLFRTLGRPRPERSPTTNIMGGGEAERDMGVLCDTVLRVLLWSDTELLEGKKYARNHAYDQRMNPNAALFLPSAELIWQFLQACPHEASFEMDVAVLLGGDNHVHGGLLEKLVRRPVLRMSGPRSVLYFRMLWPNHVTFCTSLLAHVYKTQDRTAPPYWTVLAIRLWHHLVVSMAHPATAQAVLWAADQDHMYYASSTSSSSSSSSGIKEYLRPLLRAFKLLSLVRRATDGDNDDDTLPADLALLTHSVYQVAVLLVAQSRRLEQQQQQQQQQQRLNGGRASLATAEAFTLHTTKLENAILSQCNKEQCRLWNETYFPWAISLVEQ